MVKICVASVECSACYIAQYNVIACNRRECRSGDEYHNKSLFTRARVAGISKVLKRFRGIIEGNRYFRRKSYLI